MAAEAKAHKQVCRLADVIVAHYHSAVILFPCSLEGGGVDALGAQTGKIRMDKLDRFLRVGARAAHHHAGEAVAVEQIGVKAHVYKLGVQQLLKEP